MPKLTDTQLIILTTAGQRDSGSALPLPKSVKLRGSAVNQVLKSLLNKGLLDEQPAGRDATAWRESNDRQRLMLVITDAGRRAIGIDTHQAPKKLTAAAKASTSKPRMRARQHTADSRPKRNHPPSATRAVTKQSVLIELLSRQGGATIAEAVKATGWQSHSVRGAISGTLKKKLGFTVTSEKVEGRGRVYRSAAKR